jgi:hypothetical protein
LDDEKKTYKQLRSGKNIYSGVFPWRDKNKKVININNLAIAIKNSSSFTSAQLALEMIEGVEKVRFIGS